MHANVPGKKFIMQEAIYSLLANTIDNGIHCSNCNGKHYFWLLSLWEVYNLLPRVRLYLIHFWIHHALSLRTKTLQMFPFQQSPLRTWFNHWPQTMLTSSSDCCLPPAISQFIWLMVPLCRMKVEGRFAYCNR